MNIHLKNIGIIENSNIEIKGLTVITGQNNSGKTTVGKVIYSLIDAVSNIEQKARNDKYIYAINQLEKAYDEFSFRYSLKRGKDDIYNECLKIFFANDYREHISTEKIDTYINDLIYELKHFDINEPVYQDILERYKRPLNRTKNNQEKFENELNNAILILQETVEDITRDPELIDYTKQSINTTLLTEFSGQIQPAAINNIVSLIEVTNDDSMCFRFEIENNEICDSNYPIYENSPFKRSYLIDNPFIFDEPAFRRATKYTTSNASYVNESRILTHENKLKFLINRSLSKSIFEESIIDERYKRIKEKIDAVLPGEFAFSDGDRFYICDNVKLKSANLATGSKMFSIIKMLLENGEIDDSTLLVLDEPEAHLHPKWQNMFAELIVLLVKEIRCNILLTTHSSNFMLAIDAYMRKHEIVDLCNFYQTEHREDGYLVNYKCVNGSLNNIYKDFVTYLTDVKMLRDEFSLYNEDEE